MKHGFSPLNGVEGGIQWEETTVGWVVQTIDATGTRILGEPTLCETIPERDREIERRRNRAEELAQRIIACRTRR